MSVATQPVTEESPATRPVRPYPLPLTEAERTDLHRRAGQATAEAGERRTIADVMRKALWPNGSPTE